MHIARNSVWEIDAGCNYGRGLYRVLDTDLTHQTTVVFFLGEGKKLVRPQLMGIDEIDALVEAEVMRLGVFELPARLSVSEGQITAKHKRIRDERFTIVEKFYQSSSLLGALAGNKKCAALTEFARGLNRTNTQVTKILNLYWRFGQTKNALLPAFSNCGARGNIREPNKKKRGAPRKTLLASTEMPEGRNVNASDREKILKGLKKYYLVNKPLPLAEVRRKTIADHYKTEVELAEISSRVADAPSPDQFYYWAKILVSEFEKTVKQSDPRDFVLNKRGLRGFASQNDPVPGSCYEIDATIANVHLVSRFNSKQQIGRPTVYSLTDRASRVIVGFYISLEHASWKAARQAIINAFLPKVSQYKQYGIDIVESDYPCHHLPDAITCDRGEMIGIEAEVALTPLLNLQFAPPYRADMKSIVENRFGLIDKKLFNQLDGSTLGKPKKRGVQDPEFEANLTLHKVATLLADDVLAHNRRQFDDLAKCELLLEYDQKPTPINFWKAHLAFHQHRLSELDEATLRANLMDVATAHVTSMGIEHRGLYYTCETAQKEHWQTTARASGRWKVEARVDEGDSSILFIRPSADKPLEPCSLLPRSQSLSGLHTTEISYRQDWQKKKRLVDEITVADVEAHERRECIVNEARNSQKANTSKKSKSQRRADKKRYREAEKSADNVIQLESRKPRNEKSTRRRPRRKNDLVDLIDDVFSED